MRGIFMNIFKESTKIGFLIILAISFFSCSEKMGNTGNPLLDLPESKFQRLVSNSCLTYFMTGTSPYLDSPEVSTEKKEEYKNRCPSDLQMAITFLGVPNTVTIEQIKDPKVNERFLAFKNK